MVNGEWSIKVVLYSQLPNNHSPSEVFWNKKPVLLDKLAFIIQFGFEPSRMIKV